MSSRLPRMLPVIDAFTRSTRPACRRDDRDDEFGGVAERGVEQATEGGAGARRDLLRRLSHEAGERQHAEAGGDEDEHR